MELKEKKVYINGRPLDEPYVHFLQPPGQDSEFHEVTSFDVRERYGPVTVPPNHYFVMGDNRDNSQDSRYWGFLPRDYVKGKALVIYWSYEAERQDYIDDRRRCRVERPGLGVRALLHADALGPDVPPDPLIRLIRRLISLAILALVASATWHVFLAYSAHYKFRDAVAYAAEYRGEKTDDALHDRIMEIAADADVPVEPDAVVVTHEGIATRVTVPTRVRSSSCRTGPTHGRSRSARTPTLTRRRTRSSRATFSISDPYRVTSHRNSDAPRSARASAVSSRAAASAPTRPR